MKTCSKCKRELEVGEFSKSSIAMDGHCYACKVCRSLYFKRWINNNKDRNLIVRYGITGLVRNQMLEWQDRKCAICGIKENGKKLHVDHDHKTGEVRMLLCGGCNNGGGITDNPTLLRAKAEYLEAYQS